MDFGTLLRPVDLINPIFILCYFIDIQGSQPHLHDNIFKMNTQKKNQPKSQKKRKNKIQCGGLHADT